MLSVRAASKGTKKKKKKKPSLTNHTFYLAPRKPQRPKAGLVGRAGGPFRVPCVQRALLRTGFPALNLFDSCVCFKGGYCDDGESVQNWRAHGGRGGEDFVDFLFFPGSRGKGKGAEDRAPDKVVTKVA